MDGQSDGGDGIVLEWPASAMCALVEQIQELNRAAWPAAWTLRNPESGAEDRAQAAAALQAALGPFLEDRLLPEGWELCGACGEPIPGPEAVAADDWEVGPLCAVCAEAAREAEATGDVRRCRVCGCTEDHACEGGCWWVEADLCSACVGKEERP